MYLFLTVVSLRCCAGFSLIARGRGRSPVAVGRLALRTSVAEHGPQGTWAAVAAARRHSSCDSQVREHVGSVAVAHGPSFSAASGILLDQGSNSLPHCLVESLSLSHQGSPEAFS